MSRPGIHADGFQWHKDIISNSPSHTLINPDGHQIAHVYRCDDRTWAVVDAGTGQWVTSGLATAGEGLKAADNEDRPCAYVDTDPSHGILPCDNDREPGSIYCTPHRAKAEGGDVE